MDWGDVQIHVATSQTNSSQNIEHTEKQGGDNPSESNITITFLPAQHFSARGVTDRNKTLWGGFALTVGKKSLYFAGDT